MKTILLSLAAMLLIGCGDSTTSTTTNVYTENNDTIAPIEELPEANPYGSGTIYDPFVIRENGLYNINTDTYLVTNSLDFNCTLTVNDFTNDVFDVYVYDSGYNAVPTNDGNATYLLPKYDKYNINIKSYIPVPVGIFSNCWE